LTHKHEPSGEKRGPIAPRKLDGIKKQCTESELRKRRTAPAGKRKQKNGLNQKKRNRMPGVMIETAPGNGIRKKAVTFPRVGKKK